MSEFPPPAPCDPCDPCDPSGYRGRFAPSPTGDLHFGSLLTAFGSWLMARDAGGEWLLRIEDVDRTREVAGASDRQIATLAAFGLVPDAPVVRQSERGPSYQAAVDHLLARGDAFECHCSRSDLLGSLGVHRHCIPAGARSDPAIRLRVPATAVVAFDDALQGPQVQQVAREVGDFVLRRADGCWAYQLAVVVDDAMQGVSEVVRGADLLDSTPRQILLQRLLGLPTPRYAHLPLVVDRHGRKLSKSEASLPVDPAAPLPALHGAWRSLGQSAAAVAGARSVAEFLERARAAFRRASIPRIARLDLAAMHNRHFTKAT